MDIVKINFASCVSRLATLTIASIVIVSCGGSSGTNSELFQSENGEQSGGNSLPGGEQASTLTDASWKLGDHIFITDFNRGTVQNIDGESVLIAVGNHIFDTNNGNYSGSALRITLSATGSGEYVVTDASSSDSAFGSGAKIASIQVIAGITSLNATQWVSTTTSGTLTVNVNAEGRYFVSSTAPIIVTAQREFDSGTGVVGSPDQISLEMRNINAE